MNIRISGETNNRKKKITIIVVVALVLAVVLGVCFGVVLPLVNEGNKISKVDVTKFPKLQYYVGEEADYSGLTIAIVRKNGSAEYVEYNEQTKSSFSFSGFDSSSVIDEQAITVSYRGVTAVFYVSVKEIPLPPPVLTSITIDVMPKTEYKVGEWLNTDGAFILKHYSDGSYSRAMLLNQYVKGWTSNMSVTPGTYVLTIEFDECGVRKTTTYSITVSE